jgi:hypothetical protein
MHCPFPGMDPYIERPAIWADFHDRLIPAISAALQPMLRPRYLALVQDRQYVVQAQRPIRPDVAVVESGYGPAQGTTATAVVHAEPIVFELAEEEVREPYVEIIEPAAGNRLITAIEVLSPDNKLPGPGRKKYLRKRREVLAAHANLAEIDLLRAGKPILRITPAQLASLPPRHYLAAVRRWPRRQEVYPIPLRRRLPTVAVPLQAGDRDVLLDLQAVFTRCWQEGPYPELLRYDGPPPGTITPEDLAWCEERLRQAGLPPPVAAQQREYGG